MSYYNKYLKYKKKYLDLKNIPNLSNLPNLQKGGDKPIITNIDNINLFTDPEMESYLNPIYGLILCNTGFIPNNYFLHKSEFINTEFSQLVAKVCKDIPGSIQPTNDIMLLKPIDFGRYIALKYITLVHDFITFNEHGNIIYDLKYQIDQDDRSYFTECIVKLRKFISFDKMDSFYFHIVLFCLWWTANNDRGIEQYYVGINEIFRKINKYLPSNKRYLPLKKNVKELPADSFEKILVEITFEPFKIYNQEWAKHFCPIIIKKDNETYPDCGEVTARNLINLICWNETTNNFDIDILIQMDPIEPLKEYYRVFNDFDKQSDPNYKPSIFGEELNARDAWSKLIIDFAQNNLNLMKRCESKKYNYELNAGLSVDKTITNFFQLIKNLLPKITSWEDIKNNNIIEVQDLTVKGIGDIILEHSIYKEFQIHCEPKHYYIELQKNKNKQQIKYTHLNKIQIDIIDTILKKEDTISIANYLDINFSSELLEKMFKSLKTHQDLKIKLFELSLTDKYDSDLRRRIEIDVKSEYFESVIKLFGNNIKMNEYTYKYKNFDFIRKIPVLVNLNSNFDDKNIENIDSLDLSPLLQLKSLGNGFMNGSKSLTSIDLSYLSQIKSIGDGFMDSCENLISIDLTNLSELETIGNYFMHNCIRLSSIYLPNQLSKIKSVGNSFMYDCKSLKSIDLSSLSKLELIDCLFMNNCTKLESIDLSPLTQIKYIYNNFMNNCKRLQSITLSSLSKLELIGNRFMNDCLKLSSIDFTQLIKLESIGDSFMNYCTKLSSIDFSQLTHIESIGNYFMNYCTELTTIDLSGLSKIKSIENHFMNFCTKLINIDLSNLSEVQLINDFFMYNSNSLPSINLSSLLQLRSIGKFCICDCVLLKSITLSGLSNLESIENHFINNCKSLTSIDLSGLSNLQSIGTKFINNCESLESINLSGLSNLQSIKDSFMYNCAKLTHIDLSGLSNLKTIENYFINNCTMLRNIDLSNLAELQSIGNVFMFECEGLESINLSNLLKLQSIGNYFMNDSKSLTSIYLSNLLNLQSIGNNFMEGSKSLTSIDLSGLSKLELIGNNFMNGSNKNLNIICTEKQHKILIK